VAGDSGCDKCLFERTDATQFPAQPLNHRGGDAELGVFRFQSLQAELRHCHPKILRHLGVLHHLGG
jgi:hypothetical protein